MTSEETKPMKWKDELPYLWSEYQYRHDLVWRVTIRLTFVVAFLSIIPYVNDSLNAKIGKLILVLPGLSVLLAILGSAVIANEYRLLVMIKRAYRCLQSEFFSDTFGDRKPCDIPHYPKGSLFGYFLALWLLSVIGLATANLAILASKWK
jgi:hypothetical protein